MNHQRAIIDIGSNTVRLVVYGGPRRAPIVLLNEKVTPRLGREVAKSGVISDKAMQLALSALRRYVTLLKLMNVTDVQTVATAATRDAENGHIFIAEVEKLGLTPRLLSGEEEARTSAMGVIGAFPLASGMAGDLGGGSLELTDIADGGCGDAITLPLGTLRLRQLRADGDTAFRNKVRKMLRSANWQHGEGEAFYIVGGSWRALAMYAMHHLDWPMDDPHDFEILPGALSKVCAEIVAGKTKDAVVPRIASSRMESLPDAAALLDCLVEETKPSRIVFSSWGLREGLLYTSLAPREQQQDPVIAGVAAFVKLHDVTPDTAALVVDWIGDILPGTDRVDLQFRTAATMLALAALRLEPNVRTEDALAWALRKRWIGLDARGRALFAAVSLANAGETQLPKSISPFADKDDLYWAVAWGLAIRLCRKLANCNAQGLAHSSIAIEGDRIVLTLDELTAPLYSHSVTKNLGKLAEWLELEPETRGIERA